MEHVHLCLSDLLDQDLTSYEYYQTLAPSVQKKLEDCEITTFKQLQTCVNQLKAR